jgi:LAO/AO transport system kinase
MNESHGDKGVFIRSIASRGSETGFSEKATELADVLDAFGRDVIVLETIGIGQLEYKIHFNAHTTVVVLTPEAGDDVQALKSGLMEIGDVFAVNKSDRPGGREYAEDLRSIIALRAGTSGWQPLVVTTVGTTGEGVDALSDAIAGHRAFLKENGSMDRRRVEALRSRTTTLAEEKLKDILRENEYIQGRLESVLDEVVAGRKSPYQAAAEIVKAFKIDKGKES